MLAELLRSIVSLHTDYGTEVGLVRIKPAALSEVLPYMHLSSEDCRFRDLRGNQDQDVFTEGDGGNLDEHMASGVMALQDDPDFFSTSVSSLCDMSFCLEGPDLNHVIHNITEDLSGVMKTYPDFLVGLKRICKLLASKESKQQLLENVFGSGLGLAFRSEVAGFKCKVHEKRWGTIAHAIRKVHSLEAGLRSCWSLQKFLNGRAVPEPKEDVNWEEHGVHLPGANAALLSEHWWACLSVMLQIADTQAAAIDWVNGCPCHSHLQTENVGADVCKIWAECPLRGRRCPELVAGDLFNSLQDLLGCSMACLELNLPRSLSEAEVHELLGDFDSARQYMLSTYILKLALWSEPPHALAALGHNDPATRCKFLRRCLQSQCTHPRVLQLRAHEAECLEFLESGGHWDGNFGYLSSVATEMQLLFSSAWRVEGQHARTKRGVTQATNHGAPYVSLCHRLPELRAWLKADPTAFPKLADHVAKLTSRTAIAHELRLSLPHACQAGWLTGRQSNKTTALVYHDDAYSKYTLKLPANIEQCEVQERSLVSVPALPAEEGFSQDARNLRCESARQALRALAKKDMFFSMPLNTSSMYTLRGLLAPNSGNNENIDGHLAWDPSEQLALSWPTLPAAEAVSVKEHVQGMGDVLTKEVVVWSILLNAPARFRRTKVQNAACLAGVWVVKLHGKGNEGFLERCTASLNVRKCTGRWLGDVYQQFVLAGDDAGSKVACADSFESHSFCPADGNYPPKIAHGFGTCPE